MTRNLLSATTSALALALSACGGDGAGLNSLPSAPSAPLPSSTPTPTPKPTPTASKVSIFPNPVVGDFASVGVSASARHIGADSAKIFGVLSSDDADQVHIRYTTAGNYEIQMPGAAYETLGFAKGTSPQDPQTSNDFQPLSAVENGPSLITSVAKSHGFTYSEMGVWWSASGRFGEVAFGEPTSAGQVPQTGTATYHGIVSGTSDVIGFDAFDGHYNVLVNGSVDLTFDFAKASLQGAMNVTLDDFSGASTPLGIFSFKDTVYSAGGSTYSGAFQTTAPGQNFFLGRFTGPNAQETIGAWALPFTYSVDGQNHQAFGAWIAKNH